MIKSKICSKQKNILTYFNKMPRSVMTPDGLIFIEDLNADNSPLFNTRIITRDGISYTADIGFSGPRTIIRTQPTIQSDVNNDPDLRKRVVKYFYGQFETWLFGGFRDLGDLFIEKSGSVSLGKSSDGMTSAKSDFILNEIVSKNTILKILDKYVRRKGANWYDLKTKHYDSLKSYIHTKIKSYIRKL